MSTGTRGRDAIEAIFGVDAESLASAIRTAGESNSILATVAGVVNAAALLAAVVIILLTFANALLQQGEHGRVGGRYSAVWVPLRAVLAMLMLMPLSLGGYSLVQAGVLWLGMQGSDFADKAWARSHSYLSQNLSLARDVAPRDVSETVASIFIIESCAAAVEAAAQADGSAAAAGNFGVMRPAAFSEETAGWLRRSTRYYMSFDGTGELATTKALCGTIAFELPLASEAWEQALNTRVASDMIRGITAAQSRIASIVQQRAAGELDGEGVRTALLDVTTRLARVRQQQTISVNAARAPLEIAIRERQRREAEEQGWMLAGSYYMQFAAFDAAMSRRVFTQPTFELPRVGQLPPALAADVAPALEAAIVLVPRRDEAPGPAAMIAPSDSSLAMNTARAFSPGFAGLQNTLGIGNAIEQIQRSMYDVTHDAFIALTTAARGDGSMLPRAVSLGHTLLALAGGLLLLLGTVGLVGALATGGAGFIVLLKILPVVLLLGVAGAALAYLLPVMPMLIWIAGVAGWLLMLTQAVVAAPLWAAAHVPPDGEGFAGRHALAGYMLLISLVARPLLMLAGLFAGLLIFDFISGYLMLAFSALYSASETSDAAQLPGFLGMLFYIVLAGAMLLVLARWSFSLIELIPDAVLRFIGAASEALGETRMAEQARTMAVAAYAKMQIGGAAMRGLGNLGRRPGGGVVAKK